MKRLAFNILAGCSLALCVTALVVWTLRIQGDWILRDGGGGFAAGNHVATYILSISDGDILLGWTHSDVLFEGQVTAPLWLIALIATILPLWWVWRKTRSKPKARAFPVEPSNPIGTP